jgi:hypothetical protein
MFLGEIFLENCLHQFPHQTVFRARVIGALEVLRWPLKKRL